MPEMLFTIHATFQIVVYFLVSGFKLLYVFTVRLLTSKFLQVIRAHQRFSEPPSGSLQTVSREVQRMEVKYKTIVITRPNQNLWISSLLLQFSTVIQNKIMQNVSFFFFFLLVMQKTISLFA